MKLKLRIALMVCLVLTAAFTALEAYRSINRRSGASLMPEEVYAGFVRSDAQYYLRPSGEFVAVFSGERDKAPVSVTEIELAGLRRADRAMVESGIPVSDREQLLFLLEDLGS